jgi:hypothetical protein
MERQARKMERGIRVLSHWVSEKEFLGSLGLADVAAEKSSRLHESPLSKSALLAVPR